MKQNIICLLVFTTTYIYCPSEEFIEYDEATLRRSDRIHEFREQVLEIFKMKPSNMAGIDISTFWNDYKTKYNRLPELAEFDAKFQKRIQIFDLLKEEFHFAKRGQRRYLMIGKEKSIKQQTVTEDIQHEPRTHSRVCTMQLAVFH